MVAKHQQEQRSHGKKSISKELWLQRVYYIEERMFLLQHKSQVQIFILKSSASNENFGKHVHVFILFYSTPLENGEPPNQNENENENLIQVFFVASFWWNPSTLG